MWIRIFCVCFNRDNTIHSYLITSSLLSYSNSCLATITTFCCVLLECVRKRPLFLNLIALKMLRTSFSNIVVCFISGLTNTWIHLAIHHHSLSSLMATNTLSSIRLGWTVLRRLKGRPLCKLAESLASQVVSTYPCLFVLPEFILLFFSLCRGAHHHFWLLISSLVPIV